MSNTGHLYRPYEKLVNITIGEKQFQVPEGNMLLRAMQYLAPEDVSYGRFCWNEECQYCRVTFDLGPGTPLRTAFSASGNDLFRIRIEETVNWLLREMRVEGGAFKLWA